MRTTVYTLGGAVALVTALAGCASSSPVTDATFGDAVRGMKAQQLVDPGAPMRNAGVLRNSDGRTVRESIDRYIESYSKPSQSTVTGSGGGSSGSTGN